MEEHHYLRATPLGGLGQVGGNLMVYETANDMIVVDCGILFPAQEQPGVDCLVPNINYIIANIDKLRAVVITHGHEDHIGALPFLSQSLPVPIYATGFTLALIKEKFDYFGETAQELRQLVDGKEVTIGEFLIEPIPITHSIPDAVSLAITTPMGTIIHTGDFKIDRTPVDGRLSGEKRFRELGDRGIAALFSDSTNSEKEGWSRSEQEVTEAMDALFEGTSTRILVTTFSSHIHRIQSAIRLAEKHGRRVLPLGRSMCANIGIAKKLGFLEVQPKTIIDARQFDDFPRSKILVLASGCQGEPRSAMSRIATGTHPSVHLSPEDLVIMSSRRIPGNEITVYKMTDSLVRQGINVIDDKAAPIHTSGHGFSDEQKEMLTWCRPKTFIPVHGTPRHLLRHAALAEQTGVEHHNIRIVENGTPLVLSRFPDELVIRRDEPVEAGYVCMDGLAEVDEIVLKDRRLLSELGIVVCSVVIDAEGRLLSAPAITTRGVIYVDNNEALLDECSEKVTRALERIKSGDDGEREAAIKRVIRKLFKTRLGRRPLVIPTISR